MAHQVETMAYTNEVPWHGIGTYVKDAPTVDEMLILAGLDWEVTREPMTFGDDHQEVPGFFAVTRSSDRSVLDVCGSVWKPVQNKAAFEMFREYCEAGKATMETAGSLRGGRYVWGLASLGTEFKLKNNDVVKGYLLMASPHEVGKKAIAKFVTVRVVCNNTLTLALRDGGSEYRHGHRSEFDPNKAKEALGIAREQMGEFEKNARILSKIKMTQDDAIRVLAPIYAPKVDVEDILAGDDDVKTPRLDRVLDALKNAPGAIPDTAWGVLNCVSYYSDHLASRTADKRLTNAWLGKTAGHKEKVLNTLLEMA